MNQHEHTGVHMINVVQLRPQFQGTLLGFISHYAHSDFPFSVRVKVDSKGYVVWALDDKGRSVDLSKFNYRIRKVNFINHG